MRKSPADAALLRAVSAGFPVHFGKSAAEFLCTSQSAGGHTFLAFAAASVL